MGMVLFLHIFSRCDPGGAIPILDREPEAAPVFPAGLAFCASAPDPQVEELAPRWRSDIVPLGGGPLCGELSVVHTGKLQLAYVDYSRAYSFCGESPEGTYAFIIPVEGERGVFCSRELSEFEIALARPGEQTAFHCSGATRQLVLCASATLLEPAIGLRWAHARNPHRPVFRFADGERRLEFLRDAQRLLAMGLAHPALLTRPGRAARFERALIERLLAAVRPQRRLAPIAQRHRLAYLAHRYLLDHAHENVSLLDLCRALHANERTLLLGFAETYGTAPIAYLRSIKLNGAMRDLRSGRDTTVTEVASEWGFFHFGRFSAEYRRAFGETPRETLHGARATPLTV